MAKKKETKKINSIKIEYHLIAWSILIGGLALWHPLIGLAVGSAMLIITKLALSSYEMLKIMQEEVNE